MAGMKIPAKLKRQLEFHRLRTCSRIEGEPYWIGQAKSDPMSGDVLGKDIYNVIPKVSFAKLREIVDACESFGEDCVFRREDVARQIPKFVSTRIGDEVYDRVEYLRQRPPKLP